MRLFDEGLRTELRHAKKSEPTYSYYNESARPGIVALREMLEHWFDRIPLQAKKDVRARFQSPLEFNHQGAFFELYLHELFTCLGFELQVGPPAIDRGTRPDFLVSERGVPRFYMEATIAGLSSEADRGTAARKAAVYDAINTIESPNFFFYLQLYGAPQTVPRTRKLCRDLATWLGQLDPDLVGQLYVENRYDEIPSFHWSHEGWDLSFKPIPKSPEFRGRPGVRPIGVEMPEGKWVNTHGDIRDVIERKSSRYGDLRLPFIVAANVIGDHCDNFDILNALYGQESVLVTRRANGSPVTEHGVRAPDGAWGTQKNPRNKLASGVLLAAGLSPWSMRAITPELFRHPWCTYPLEAHGWALPQWTLDDGVQPPQLCHQPGCQAGEILGVPSPWPICND
jgi:hypothetical protein